MPNITGVLVNLSLETFNATRPSDGKFVHFKDRFSDNAQTIPINHSQPVRNQNQVELVNQGITTRDFITNLFTQHGDPLFGIFISSGGELVPHTAIVRQDFNSLMTNGPKTPDNLQNSFETILESYYKSEEEITDSTDPDFGQTITLRSFWAVTHFFNHVQNGLYDPAVDYKLIISDNSPPGNWWQ